MSSASVIASAHMKTSNDQLRSIRPKLKTFEVQAGVVTNSINQIVNGGTLDYDFRVPKGSVWRPRESYWRYRVKVTKPQVPGQPLAGFRQASLRLDCLEVDEEIGMIQQVEFERVNNLPDGKEFNHALAFNAGSTPFQQMTLQLGGTPIDTTNQIAIIDSALKRLQYSNSKAKDFGADALSSSYLDRQQAISKPIEWDQGAVDDLAPHVNQPFALSRCTYQDGSLGYEFTYTPSFSYWAHDSLPSGDYRISCLPVTEDQLRKSFLTSLSDPADVNLEIEMQFFVTIMQSDQKYDKILLDLDVIDYQAKDVIADSNQQNSFDIKSSCHSIITAFQSNKNNAGKFITHPITQFIGQPEVPGDLDPIKSNNRYWLKDYYMEHNGESQPLNHYRCAEQNETHQLMRQIYLDNQIKLGNVLTGHQSEDFGSFTYLGPMLYFNIDSKQDCPPRVNTYFTVAPSAGVVLNQLKQLFITISRAVCTIEYDHDRVKSVRTVLA